MSPNSLSKIVIYLNSAEIVAGDFRGDRPQFSKYTQTADLAPIFNQIIGDSSSTDITFILGNTISQDLKISGGSISGIPESLQQALDQLHSRHPDLKIEILSAITILAELGKPPGSNEQVPELFYYPVKKPATLEIDSPKPSLWKKLQTLIFPSH